jgi:hypothetical protein
MGCARAGCMAEETICGWQTIEELAVPFAARAAEVPARTEES